MRSNLNSEGGFLNKFSRYRNQKIGFDSSDIGVYGATMFILYEAPESMFKKGQREKLIAFLSAKLQEQFFQGGVANDRKRLR